MSIKIAYRDFVPADRTQTLDFNRSFEPLDSVVERVNQWLAESGSADVLHIETLLLPVTMANKDKASAQSHVGMDHSLQVIRVWYRG